MTFAPTLDQLLADNPAYMHEAITTREAARILNVTPSALAMMRQRGTGPDFSQEGRFIRYTRAWIFEWLEATKRRVAI